MFKRKTVFVVGAGASAEFKLPVGSGLAKKIQSKLSFSNDTFGQVTGGDPNVWSAIKYVTAISVDGKPTINEYYITSNKISGAMHQAASIDNFIDAHRGDTVTESLGKLAIAASILESERESSLFAEAHRYRPAEMMRENQQAWMMNFQRMAFERRYRDEVTNAFDGVGFITFNYDRCIELFLFNAAKSYFDIPDEAAASLVNSVPILHVYGSVGRLAWQNGADQEVAFGEEINGRELWKVANRIKTFTESFSGRGEILDLMNGAENVVLLGCGYHEQNLDVLRLNSVRPGSPSKMVLGTALGISPANCDIITSYIVGNLSWRFGPQPILRRDLGCRDLLSDYHKVLTSG